MVCCVGAAGNGLGSEASGTVSPRVWGPWWVRRTGAKSPEPGQLAAWVPESDSGGSPGHAFVWCTVPSWAMTYDRQSPWLGGGERVGASESA